MIYYINGELYPDTTEARHEDLYGEVKDSVGPITPERAVWDQRAEE